MTYTGFQRQCQSPIQGLDQPHSLHLHQDPKYSQACLHQTNIYVSKLVAQFTLKGKIYAESQTASQMRWLFYHTHQPDKFYIKDPGIVMQNSKYHKDVLDDRISFTTVIGCSSYFAEHENTISCFLSAVVEGKGNTRSIHWNYAPAMNSKRHIAPLSKIEVPRLVGLNKNSSPTTLSQTDPCITHIYQTINAVEGQFVVFSPERPANVKTTLKIPLPP